MNSVREQPPHVSLNYLQVDGVSRGMYLATLTFRSEGHRVC